MKVYNKDLVLKGKVLITKKIDGVQAIKNSNGIITSRKNKTLYNIPDFNGTKAEIFLGSFKESISRTKTKVGDLIDTESVYVLEPKIDSRLVITTIENPTHTQINEIFEFVRKSGDEGLVIYTKNETYKLKADITIDATIIGIIEGRGKHTNKMGALTVKYNESIFNVGTGFTDIERTEFNDIGLLGETIEVKGMEVLPSGRLRHPRFVRMRADK